METSAIKEAVEMRRAHLNLIKYALNKGCSITVDYGAYDDEDACTKSKDYKEIKEHAEACDESYLHIYDAEGKKKGWAWVIFGNEDNELVSDYSYNPFMEDWWQQFDKMYEETGAW
tara:strand:+ start:6553 stop:6900 length:348 start_codon:yes stop_codon:yes gene_type:complete